ncbi:MAG: flagellin lysine-N-methylase [Geminicoccaceae bacterium]
MLQPAYMAQFRCVGDACIDNCCHHWTVDVAEPTVRQYRNAPAGAIKEDLLAALTRVKVGEGKKRMIIRQRSDGRCAMQDENGLCRIQSELGEAYLSPTCASFPRITTLFDEVFHRVGTMACPEVARSLITDPHALVDKESFSDTAKPRKQPAQKQKPGPVDARMIRHAMLTILTATHQPWSGRISLAGLFAQDLAKIDLAADPGAVGRLAGQMFEIVDRIDLAQHQAQGVNSPERSLRAFTVICRAMLKQMAARRIADPKHQELLNTVFNALGVNTADMATVFERFTAVQMDLLAPAIDGRPHLPGNVLANALFQVGFVPDRISNCWAQFSKASIHYAMFLVLLTGLLAVEDETPFEDRAVRAAYLLARILLHNKSLVVEAQAGLAEKQLDDLPALMAITSVSAAPSGTAEAA